MVLNKINDIFILSKFSKRRSIVEKENTGSRIKRRIIVIVFSMLLCMLLIGVSVYAALSQTLTSPGTITITTAGQARLASPLTGQPARPKKTLCLQASAIK